MNDYLRDVLKRKPAPVVAAVAKVEPVLDAVDDTPEMTGADSYTQADIALKAVAVVQQWVETDDLDDDESLADRLANMVVGIADANKDGEISDDEQAVVDIALNSIWDYLAQYEVADDDISALLNDWDTDAAERIRDLLAASLPEGEAADADIDNFVFGGTDQEPALDAVYKKKIVIRHGKKMRINKRISGRVKLSAKQKVAIKKAGLKSHNAAAQMRRAKSMRMRVKTGL
ncbi:MAG: hypothetical protein M0Q44_01365 [Methylobacter sp.]|jgi:hypothetical protein|nr:hypothetical protein [Methylobacter sp.]